MSKEKHIEEAEIVVDLSGGRLAAQAYRKRIKQLQTELDKTKEIIENTKKCVANNPVYIYGPGQCMLEQALKEVKP